MLMLHNFNRANPLFDRKHAHPEMKISNNQEKLTSLRLQVGQLFSKNDTAGLARAKGQRQFQCIRNKEYRPDFLMMTQGTSQCNGKY